MQLEKVTAEIRPRRPWEAVDLGISLTRTHIGTIAKGWLLSVVPICLLVFGLCWNQGGIGIFFVWWMKPVWERVALHPISRGLFGEAPTAGETALVLWQEVKRQKLLGGAGVVLSVSGWWVFQGSEVWTGMWFLGVLCCYLLLRGSPQRSFFAPISYLEGLKGEKLKQRKKTIGGNYSSAGVGLTFASLILEAFLVFNLVTATAQFLPDGVLAGSGFEGSTTRDRLSGVEGFLIAVFYLISMSVTAWFYVGGGFGLYLNSRTWSEGWDIELGFRRLARRIGLIAIGCLCFFGGDHLQAETAQEQAAEILRGEDFEVKTEEFKVMKPDGDELEEDSGKGSRDFSAGIFAGVGSLIFWLVVLFAIGLIGWLLYLNRHLLGGDRSSSRSDQRATVTTVAGLNITPESLPDEILKTAKSLWAEGRYQEALGLLYRGAIADLVMRQVVEIRESDTEIDCQERVQDAGEAGHPGYFTKLTGAWTMIAYARRRPVAEVMDELWAGWPYEEKGGRRR